MNLKYKLVIGVCTAMLQDSCPASDKNHDIYDVCGVKFYLGF